jgi:hypothetical protein
LLPLQGRVGGSKVAEIVYLEPWEAFVDPGFFPESPKLLRPFIQDFWNNMIDLQLEVIERLTADVAESIPRAPNCDFIRLLDLKFRHVKRRD